ncbi:MAG: hypothetical protein SGJ00_06075 [bacterium]|nr:hypothetical protein [bacterium]
MKRTTKSQAEQESIIAEYLLGEKSYRQLGKQHEIDFSLKHSWVSKFKGKPLSQRKTKKAKRSIISFITNFAASSHTVCITMHSAYRSKANFVLTCLPIHPSNTTCK